MTFPFIPFNRRVAASVSSTDHAVDTSDASTYTFTSKAIGTAALNRIVVVGVAGVSGGPGRTISAFTIGGVAATQLIFKQANDGAGFFDVALYALQVDTGTTATIAVTWSSAQIRTSIGVWAVYSVDSAAPTATAFSSANPLSASLAISAGGVAIGFASAYQGGAAPTYTWANLTERFDETVEGTTSQTGADTSSLTATTPTITATPSAFSAGQLVMASFR